MHGDQITIDADTVRRLVAEQFPQWSGLSCRLVPTGGTVNAIVRLGDDLAARLPLRPGPVAEIRAGLELEARSARAFADVSPVPSPEPVAIGEPGVGYPLPWSIQTWLDGTDADSVSDDSQHSPGFADDLAELVLGLRAADPACFENREAWRGGDLRAKDAWVLESLDKSRHLVDVSGLGRLWAELRDLPRAGPDVVSHGDLIPGNVLVADGRLAGLLDTGGAAITDRALDLIAGWHLLDDQLRERFRRRTGCTDLEWRRATAWALEQAIGAAHYYEHTNTAMFTMGMRTLGRILAAE